MSGGWPPALPGMPHLVGSGQSSGGMWVTLMSMEPEVMRGIRPTALQLDGASRLIGAVGEASHPPTSGPVDHLIVTATLTFSVVGYAMVDRAQGRWIVRLDQPGCRAERVLDVDAWRLRRAVRAARLA